MIITIKLLLTTYILFKLTYDHGFKNQIGPIDHNFGPIQSSELSW